jgi:hypothetical protein
VASRSSTIGAADDASWSFTSVSSSVPTNINQNNS